MNNTLLNASVISLSLIIGACAEQQIKPTNDSNKDLQHNVANNVVDQNNDVMPMTQQSDSVDENKISENQEHKPVKFSINFDFDQSNISDTDKIIIQQQADFLRSNPKYVLSINGHADNRGPLVYNEKLSLARANSVAALLLSFGASESQLIINSFGATAPLQDEKNWIQNRRVELEYSELYMVSK